MTDPKLATKRKKDPAAKAKRKRAKRVAVKPKDVEGSGGEKPTFRRRTDLGNAERLADHAEGRLIWVYGYGWLTWDGKRWTRDQSNGAARLAAETVRLIYTEGSSIGASASKATDDDEAKEWGKQAEKTMKHAAQSESRRSIDAMLKLGQSQRRLVLEGGALGLDANPDAINVANGIVDLQTFERRDHDPAEHHTRVANAEYKPGAQSELWDDFLRVVLPDDEVRRWLQKAAGSALRGRYSEDLFIPWGSGKNGKSTILRAIRHALGDYAMEAAPELLIRKRGSRSAGDMSAMADLQGRRFVTTIETGQGKRLDEVFVKQLTGEHVLKAKFMRQDWFEFENRTTICLATNHKPDVQGADIAIWERLHLVPFNVFVKPEDRDPELGTKLERPEHQAAILAWLVEGLRMFDAEGLRPAPQAITEATDSYKEEMDPLHEWIESSCDLSDPEAVTPIKWVQDNYAGHCEHTNANQVAEADFRESLTGRGLTRPPKSVRIGGKVRKVWKGIKLLNDEDWYHEFMENQKQPEGG